MSSDKNMEGMYQQEKPTVPDGEGKQYAAHDPVSSSGHLQTTYNQDYSELVADRPMHENTTAGEGSFHWDAKHYNEDFGGGESKNYGVEVADHGKSPQVERTSVDVSRADRGREA